MKKPNCKSCQLNNEDLEEFSEGLTASMTTSAKKAITLGIVAQSHGDTSAARQLETVAMLMIRAANVANLLSEEHYRCTKPSRIRAKKRPTRRTGIKLHQGRIQ